MTRTAQISKEKQSITLRHDAQSIQKVSTRAVAKTISAVMKMALTRTATGKVDPEIPLLQRTSSLEFTASNIAAQINASEFK
jgi:hypothetical protein